MPLVLSLLNGLISVSNVRKKIAITIPT
jgi:hypothetical protein